MTYDIGYVIVIAILSGFTGFGLAYGKYQKLIDEQFQRGKEIGRASQRHSESRF